MENKQCPYCKKRFSTDFVLKKFCCAECRAKYGRLKIVKEVFRLSDYDQQIRKEALKEGI